LTTFGRKIKEGDENVDGGGGRLREVKECEEKSKIEVPK